jgi:membrane protein
MKDKFLSLWESIWTARSEDQSNSFLRSFKSIFRLFFSATYRFNKDEDLIRAASISYAIVVSFIPTLILALLLAANFINIKDYEELAKEYVRKNSIPIDIHAYFKIIYELLNNTAALTGIGFLFVLFSTTSVLRNLEDAMNKIWNVKKKRPLIQKIAEFIMIVIFGPVLLAIGLSTGQSLLREFSAPSLLRMESSSKLEYIVGEKRVLLKKTKDKKWVYTNILDKIDYDLQKDPIIFDPETNKVLSEIELQPLQQRIKRVTKQELRTSSFIDISIVGNHIFILTNDGTLISSKDGGKFWAARKFQKKQLSILVRANFHRLKMFDETKGIIIGKSGLILTTEDGGDSWNSRYNPEVKTDLNDVAEVSPGEILIIGEDLTAISSKDFGRRWNPYMPIHGLNNFDKENLNSISVFEESIFICGDAGAILTSKDGGQSWYKKNIGFKKIDFFDIDFIDEQQGVMVGDSGNIRYTFDGGVTWKKSKSPTQQNLLHVNYNQNDKTYYILGENYHILMNTSSDMNSFKIIEKTPFWRIAISALGRFFLPFSVLWLIFIFVYQILPYTKVQFKPAAIGAFCTSLALVGFIIGFQYYVAFFSAGKFAIYGTLAAIPLVLLLIYVSTIIILYGCEITYLIQHPDLIYYVHNRKNLEELEKQQVWRGVQVIHRIFLNFQKGNGETTVEELLKYTKLEPIELDRITSIFVKNQWIGRIEEGGWIPLLAADLVPLENLFTTLSPTGFENIEPNPKTYLETELRKLFEKYTQVKKELFHEKTLADLLEQKNSKTLI